MNKYAGVLYRSGDKILFLRRSKEVLRSGVWGFPGGHIDKGETPEQAAARECLEEVGHYPQNLKHLHTSDNGYVLFLCECAPFEPVLNQEHDALVWTTQEYLPTPLHPGIIKLFEGKAMDSVREIDINGYITIKDNPIIREGVFPYLGSSIDPEGKDPAIDPNKIYNVYRPGDEIEKASSSFKMLPFIHEHTMLGPSDEGYTPPEKKGVDGITGEDIAFRNGVLYSNLKIFSETLANIIKKGKKELSLGYRCAFIKQAGIFAGQAYDFVQRSLKGNHLALVIKGRNNVSVLDKSIVFDHFDLNLEIKEKSMPTIEELAAKVTAQDEAIAKLTEQNTKLQSTLDEMEKDKEKAEDEDDEKEKDKAEDEDDDKKDDEAEDEETQKDPSKEPVEMKNSALDEAVKQIKALSDEVNTLKKSGIKSLVSEVSRRNSLASKISQHVGTFDHEDKTLDEVAKYGVEKLGLKCPEGHEQTALDAFFFNRPNCVQAFAMDGESKSPSVDSYLNKKA